LACFPVCVCRLVLEIVAGIVLRPSVLDWVRVDAPLQVLSMLGLAFLLFLAGLEVDPRQLRGRLLGLVGIGFALSFAIGLAVAAGLSAAGLVETPLLVGINHPDGHLAGRGDPRAEDAGQVQTDFGQLTVGNEFCVLADRRSRSEAAHRARPPSGRLPTLTRTR
jgi:Sodium/hydrogen exchanger family